MYLKHYKTNTGRVYMTIVHGYRDPKTKKARQVTVQKIGYVDDFLDQYEDPIAHFKAVAAKMEKERLEAEGDRTETITVTMSQKMTPGTDELKHLGYLPLSAIYHSLEIDSFLISRQRQFNIQYSLNDLLQLLIYTRVLAPDREVVKAYHDLWEIEHSFRITKDTIETQPVNLTLEQRIDAHFMTCFYALLFIRLLGKITGQAHAPEQMVDSLKRFQTGPVDANIFRTFYYDNVIDSLGQALKIPLDSLFYTKNDLRKLNAQTKRFEPRP